MGSGVVVEDVRGALGEVGQRETGPVPKPKIRHAVHRGLQAGQALALPAAQAGRGSGRPMGQVAVHPPVPPVEGGIDGRLHVGRLGVASHLGQGHRRVGAPHGPPPADSARPGQLIPESADHATQVAGQPVHRGGEFQQVGVAERGVAGDGIGEQRAGHASM